MKWRTAAVTGARSSLTAEAACSHAPCAERASDESLVARHLPAVPVLGCSNGSLRIGDWSSSHSGNANVLSCGRHIYQQPDGDHLGHDERFFDLLHNRWYDADDIIDEVLLRDNGQRDKDAESDCDEIGLHELSRNGCLHACGTHPFAVLMNSILIFSSRQIESAGRVASTMSVPLSLSRITKAFERGVSPRSSMGIPFTNRAL